MKVNYPKNRKKKRNHAQFFDFYRVIDLWKKVPEIFYMFKIDGKFYACKPDSLFDDNIILDGSTYRPIHDVPDYDGQDGDMVYGYVSIIRYSNMNATLSRFVFLKDTIMKTGLDLTRFVRLKYTVNQNKHLKFHLWE